MGFWNLLADAAEDVAEKSWWDQYGGTLILIVVFVGIFVAMMFFNRSNQKKRQQETDNMLNAIKPGNKVKTIGGICGIVVEVCPEDNTFVLETGTEASGKSYIKFDKQAVYQTDAVPTPVVIDEPKAEETPVVEETPEEPFEEVAAQPEETATEAVAEEATETIVAEPVEEVKE